MIQIGFIEYCIVIFFITNFYMEKSLVREFSNVSNSFFGNTSRTGFVRTFQNGSDLGKSRIQNLPGYKKDDLSKRLDMVVVFQSIEIDRLSVQIQSLRVQLKDSERQLNNYLSYQVQIKQLTEHSMHLQQENSHYKQEIQKMNMICQKMYLELQQFHQKFDNKDPHIEQKYKNTIKSEKNLQKQIQSIRMSFAQKTDELNKQIKNLSQKNKFQQNQIGKLVKKLKQNEQILCQKDNEEIKSLKKIEIQMNEKINNLNKELALKSQGLQNIKIIVKNKISEFQHQKSKLLPSGAEIEQKIKKIQQKLIMHQQKLQNDLAILSRQNQMLSNDNFQKEKELKELRTSFRFQIENLEKINNQIQNQLTLHESRSSQYQSQIKNFLNQNTQLTQQLALKTKQNNQLQSQLKNIRKELNEKIETIHKEKLIIQNRLVSIDKQIQTRIEQVRMYKKIILQLKVQNELIIKQKQNYIQSFNLTVQGIDKFYKKFNQQKQTILQLQCRNSQLQGTIKTLKTTNMMYQKQLKSYQQKFNHVSNQNEVLKKQFQNLKKNYSQNDKRLKQVQKAYMQQVQNVKFQYESQVRQLKDSFKQVNEQKSMVVHQLSALKLFSQSQLSLSTQLLKRIQISYKILKQIKQKYQKLQNDKGLKDQSLISRLNQVFKINDGFADKVIKLQDVISLLENQNLKLQSDKKILNFEMVQTHKINSLQKRRDSRTSVDSNSLRSFANLPSTVKNKDKIDPFIRTSSKQPFSSSIFENPSSSQRNIFNQINQNTC